MAKDQINQNSKRNYFQIIPGVEVELESLRQARSTTYSPHQFKQEIDLLYTPEAFNFFAKIHREFNPVRLRLLEDRIKRQNRITSGEKPDFLKETKSIRESGWRVAPTPADLEDRRVEITGPVDAKMMINALNSGAKVFMADLEDANSPTWFNVSEGLINLKKAMRRELKFDSPDGGKSYRLSDVLATLLVRPRGWHLNENHVRIDGEPVSASLFDFCFYFFHNATESLKRGTGPYFYLPKMESHFEARLWNSVFTAAQPMAGVPHGTVRATVLIETILASFEMEEILYELKDHMAGLNAGRWDYIFSAIKKFRDDPNFVTPDRSQIAMTVPFMRAYTDLLVRTCHKRGAHAIGGMAAFIPSRKDVEVNKVAVSKVNEDKEREAKDGFDGTWVAHPDLVPIAQAVFDRVMGADVPNQKGNLREDVLMDDGAYAQKLINFKIEGGRVSEQGVRTNINVGLQYIERWLGGLGAVAIHNLMEDAATAEISRAQLWQWVHHGVRLDSGIVMNSQVYEKICKEEIEKLEGGFERYQKAKALMDELVIKNWKHDFLTLPAYEMIS